MLVATEHTSPGLYWRLLLHHKIRMPVGGRVAGKIGIISSLQNGKLYIRCEPSEIFGISYIRKRKGTEHWRRDTKLIQKSNVI